MAESSSSDGKRAAGAGLPPAESEPASEPVPLVYAPPYPAPPPAAPPTVGMESSRGQGREAEPGPPGH
ncbi:hypothetical protein [Yinghuangia sp. YIM S09857]|uniref:hypothetical protein n=1 Tax=Yinghuangia sp. YIM S09857 TaxID=3436929 RepID=UPI003F531B69